LALHTVRSITRKIVRWDAFVHYVTLHMPAEPNGFYHYSPLQQLAYFGVIFLMAPLSLLTGMAMSPALDNRFPWFPKTFGGRQAARSLHFILLVGYLGLLLPQGVSPGV
jgi:methionine sulfoxide reductase catalytic subunit